MGTMPTSPVSLGAGVPGSELLSGLAKQRAECFSRDCPYRRKASRIGILDGDTPWPICWECRLHRLRSNTKGERGYFSSSYRTAIPADRRIEDHVSSSGESRRNLQTLP